MAIDKWQLTAISLSSKGVTWREVARMVDVPRSTVSDYLRSYYKELGLVRDSSKRNSVDASADNSRVLFISDMHIPYHHPNLLTFLKALKKRYNPTRIICVGDELDYHAISFHDSDADLFSAGHELAKAVGFIQEIHKIFPVMDLIDSNHGSLVYRKAKHHGIPRHCIKTYNEILGVGDGWKWHDDLTIELPDGQSVYIHHGKSADGLKLSQTMGMSCVQGHYHNSFGTSYWANSLGLYFSMQIGCLIDNESYAFNYNNVNLKRPLIGTGLIINGRPILEPMVLE